MDRVQWLNDQGGWEIGRIYRPNGVWPVSECRGIVPNSSVTNNCRLLIIPYHDPGNPVFVEYGKLTPRPDQHHE